MYLGVVLISRLNKKSLIRWKVYIDRSKMYIGYVQFLLIIFVFIKSLGDNLVTEFVFNSPLIAVPIILVIFVLASLVIGYLDSRLGFREEEIRNHSKSNPVLMDIQKSHKWNKIKTLKLPQKIHNDLLKKTINTSLASAS